MRVSLSANDEQAQRLLWQAFRTELLRFVRRRLADESVAEDIVHDVLIKAFSRRDELRDDSRLRAWLYQITRNALVDHYRAHKPLAPLPAELAEWPEADDRAEAELALCLRPLMDKLPEKYRAALLSTLESGLSQEQYASQAGLSISGAKSRVQRGRTMLRDALVECCRVEMNQRGEVLNYDVGEGCQCR
ncbi:RNA polymerase sigma factor SigZ [Billgrantia sulfidoxydans]|uniref:RNA polymerase sigma factor SigZ n=1 Tax=Billgrantia sulfidoxydans TaxID=2733484 RepID=A0ABX7W4G7_9GAMM|nr:RNA polymerase sigma factor SigZ [Halomonas sulfidoxydans]QTP54761.1 RNA polymerase sigma factor SigZ [Halomonas sulfidoxydans]